MTSAFAASFAALGTAALIAAIGSGQARDPLGGLEIVQPGSRRATNALDRIGAWPVLRRIGVSRATAIRLELCGAGWNGRRVVGSKAVASTTLALTGLAVAGPLLAIPAVLVGWRMPDLVLARLAGRTVAEADREIPVLMDLLAVATSAGLPPQLAFRRAVDAATGPLADELRSVINASDLGGRWRVELMSVGERLDLPDLRRLLGALARTDTLGSSLADEVARLASDIREVRRAAAAQRARTAPVKMLFPLVFLVLPAFLLLTVVPVLMTTVRSIA